MALDAFEICRVRNLAINFSQVYSTNAPRFLREGDDQYPKANFAHVELKNKLKPDGFNHSFLNLKWIVCWDFDKTAIPSTEFKSVIDETDVRRLEVDSEGDLGPVYFSRP